MLAIPHSFQSLSLATLLLISVLGCDQSEQAPSASESMAPTTEQLRDAVAKAELEAQSVVPPKPKIALPTPTGWSRTETRPLPAKDEGFSVGYEHESGLSVTLYQYTRGHRSIPNDLTNPIVKLEMDRARTGIKQAVQLGYWQAAKETQAKTVNLGDTKQQALWAQHELTMEGMTLLSETYVWSSLNTLFKIRCTSRSDDAASNQAALESLLTALGSATQ